MATNSSTRQSGRNSSQCNHSTQLSFRVANSFQLVLLFVREVRSAPRKSAPARGAKWGVRRSYTYAQFASGPASCADGSLISLSHLRGGFFAARRSNDKSQGSALRRASSRRTFAFPLAALSFTSEPARGAGVLYPSLTSGATYDVYIGS